MRTAEDGIAVDSGTGLARARWWGRWSGACARGAAVAIAAVLGALAAIPAAAQDQVAAPWGCANGDVSGRARSSSIPMLFEFGAEEAWVYDPTADLGSRVAGRGSIVFDEDGNLYWHTTGGLLMSVDPDGLFRWIATDPLGGFFLDFGVANSTSPIVGVERAYLLGGAGSGVAGEPLLAAVDKATGEGIWQTLLPEDPSGDSFLTPILDQGKLHVVGQSDGVTTSVYQVDAATGAIDWTSSVAIPLEFRGTMALLPDQYGVGVHGLYFNGDSGSGSDGVGEMYALSVDSDPLAGGAALAWQADAGKAARSHVIAAPDAPGGPRLYTHTWNDYGGTLYSFDPDTGVAVVNANGAGSGHGFYDVGCLDFDDDALVCGGFDGQVVVYTDDGTGSTSDEVFQYSELDPAGWFGEYRALGQLLTDASGGAYLVSGTNSRVTDFGTDHTARAVILDLADGVSGEDGPVWIDDITVSQGPDPATLTVVFEEDFEGLLLGDLPGQGGWQDDRAAPSGGTTLAQLVDDPQASGQGQVLELDAEGSGGGWKGVFHDFADTSADTVVVEYRQLRGDLTDNLWPYFGDAVNDFSEGWTLAWDATQAYFPYHYADAGGSTVAQTIDTWQLVRFTYENINDPDPAQRTVTVEIDGVAGTAVTQDLGFNPTASIRGFGVQLEGTGPTTGASAAGPLLSWDTAQQVDHGFTLRGGPLVGPDGKLYYFGGEDNLLHALAPLTGPTGTAFIRGDANDDGAFDISDAVFTLGALFVPGSPASTCEDAADANDDGAVDISDAVYSLSALFIPGSPAPPLPHPGCGVDPTDDALDCAIFGGCP